MRSSMKILVAAAATLLVAPQFAMADDIEEQLRLMNERMGQLESQLQATQDELEASKTTVANQQDLIEKAGIEREAQSGLSAFLSQTQFDGFVAASYTYNFTGIDETRQAKYAGPNGGNDGTTLLGGVNNGATGLTAPLHPNNNTFQVDQVWFGMRKPATTESRGGWGVDLVWGVGADNLGTPANLSALVYQIATSTIFDARGTGSALATGDLPHLYQGYVEYLAPIGDILIKAGRFETMFGAEVFRQDSNFNITRGLLWALQPKNQTGITIGSEYDNGLTWTVGVANSYSATMADSDNEKTFIGQLGYRGESFAVLLNGLYGGNPSDLGLGGMNCSDFDGDIFFACEGRDGDSIALMDLVMTWDPMESLSTWVNFDYYWFNNSGKGFGGPGWDFDRMNIYGVSGGARWGFIERAGMAVRFEWLRGEFHPYFFGFPIPPFGSQTFCCANIGQDVDLFSVTGTLDYALTDNLTLKVEGRYDWGKDNKSSDDLFQSARELGYPQYTHSGQGLGLVEMLYRF
jgi:hypothetical protein